MAGEVEAAASILKTLFGEKRLGAAAAPFQPGESLGVGGGLFDTLQAIQQFAPQQDISGLVGTQGQELFPQVRANEPVTSLPSVFNTEAQNVALGPSEGEPGFVGPSNIPSGQQQSPFASFFGNLDQNLQSPSKVLGLGLLNQLDPRLAGLGLFAGGLFGQNKLF